MTVKAKVDAIDRFVRTLKSGGQWDDIQAACVMAGWTNLAGALYPLKGSAPTNNGFLAADLDPGIGLTGDGSSKYLNSNRAGNADGQNDRHVSAFTSDRGSRIGGARYIASGDSSSQDTFINNFSASVVISSLSNASYEQFAYSAAGFLGGSRSISTSFDFRFGGSTSTRNRTSGTPNTENFGIFCRSIGDLAFSDATLSWYSIGSATDLAAMDSAVSTLMSDLRAIDEDGFEPETVNYLRAVEAADGGAYLETGVKQAVNRFIVGLKKDSSGVPGRSLWDALKSSCILCGARTISGALVPLAGTAPTAYGDWSSGDYNRETGLKGNGSTKYLDSNRAGNADGLNDHHLAVFFASPYTASAGCFAGTRSASKIGTQLTYDASAAFFISASKAQNAGAVATLNGLYGLSRKQSSGFDYRYNGSTASANLTADAVTAENVFIFNRPVNSLFSDARLAFYSIGPAISDLALLDTRVSNLVTEIAAAIQ